MIASLVIAALAVAFAVRFYWELWKWARQCQHARIVVAYKNRVRLNAPLVEWLLWCNQLDEDKDANGRVIYAIGGSSVAIVKKSFMRERISHKLIRSVRPQKAKATSAPRVRQGTWSAQDETKRT
jgi:hypothetical protein